MRKKIPVEELKPGMWVTELDRPWRETPLLFQGFEVKDDHDIDEIRRHCRYVFIETSEEHDAAIHHLPGTPESRVQFSPAARRQEFTVLKKFAAGPPPAPRYPDRTTLEQELPRAREVVRESKLLMQDIMDDVRVGQSLNTAVAKQAVARMVDSILDNPDALVCLGQIKSKDQYTAEHGLRVCIIALAFGRHLGLEAPDLNYLGIGALLHDIGKVRIPLEILNKPTRLTAEEFEVMKMHVPHGVDILQATPGIPPPAIDLVRYHHERFDGTGYVSGTKGEQIGLFGSIGAIVDCYDAITSDRTYHNGMSSFDALNRMYEWRGKDLHPELTEQFIQCMGVYPIGSVVELNTGAVGVVISVNRFRRLRPRLQLVLTPEKTPYAPPRMIDLMQLDAETGGVPVEIRHVLPHGAHGVNPADYLPKP